MNKKVNPQSIVQELLQNLTQGIISKWYPTCVDNTDGGYYSNLSYNFGIMSDQDKMIVTQARHIWALSKIAIFFEDEKFKDYAFHGFKFLKDKMWDEKYGGFYTMRSREGNFSSYNGYDEEKRMYGNAFAIYGLAALYEISKDENVLNLAKETFNWTEEKAADKEYNGYFQFITREGNPFDKNSEHKTKAIDANEVGLKDQNSSIHLLEAYTELYNVWQSPELESRLKNILFLIRDVQITKEGYLNLFFDREWKPISFRNVSEEIRKQNYGLEHVSFGHNYETAFLMLEASYSLGIKNDTQSLSVAKKMMDHAIENGWDNSSAGFFDEGYYFKGNDKCQIIKDTKVWWAQAEGLNALLLFSKIFPDEKKYYKLFLRQWQYIKEYLIDLENGDWYWGSLEKEPFYKFEPKANIWKCTYHTGRTLMNCIKMMDDGTLTMDNNSGYKKEKERFGKFIGHWRNTTKLLR
jgi:mannobiose 2-epimerase